MQTRKMASELSEMLKLLKGIQEERVADKAAEEERRQKEEERRQKEEERRQKEEERRRQEKAADEERRRQEKAADEERRRQEKAADEQRRCQEKAADEERCCQEKAADEERRRQEEDRRQTELMEKMSKHDETLSKIDTALTKHVEEIHAKIDGIDIRVHSVEERVNKVSSDMDNRIRLVVREQLESNMKQYKMVINSAKSHEDVNSVISVPAEKTNNVEFPIVDAACSTHEVKVPEFDASYSWDMYKVQFATAARENGWSDSKQASRLVLALRGSALDLLQTVPEEERTSFKTLSRYFDNRYGSSHLKDVNRQKLKMRHQNSGESLQDFYVEIEKLVSSAYPEQTKDFKDSQITEAFIDGLSDRDMQLSLRLSGINVGVEALSKALYYETAKRVSNGSTESRVRQLTAEPLDICEMRKMYCEMKEFNKELNKNKDRQCYACGRFGHLARKCWKNRENRKRQMCMSQHPCPVTVESSPLSVSEIKKRQRSDPYIDTAYEDRRCYCCGRTGHLAKGCWCENCRQQGKSSINQPKKTEKASIDERFEESSQTTPKACILKLDQTEGLTLKGSIGGKCRTFTIDTGAMKSVIRPDISTKRISRPQKNVRLRTATGESTDILGEVKLNFSVDNVVFQHVFLVANIEDQCLLGLDIMKKYGFHVNVAEKLLRIGNQEFPLQITSTSKLNSAGFQEQDSVWLYNPLRKKGRCPDLRRDWQGPYRVTKRLNDVVYRIRMEPRGKMKVVYIDRLKPYQGTNEVNVRDEQS